MKRLAMMVVLMTASTVSAADGLQTQQFRPKWNVGDQWTVETQSRQQQVAATRQIRVAARWQFSVEAVDNIAGTACFRIVIRPTDAPQPKTTVWINRDTTAIRQIQTQLPTTDGYKTMTESYRTGGRAAPVVGPLTVLPLDLPQFPEPGVKSLGTYQYEAVSGPDGIKAVGDIGFSTEIRQSLSRPSADRMKSLFGDENIKSLEGSPLVEVELSTPDYSTRQIWSGGGPWPMFSDNGVTQARLVEVTRAAHARRENGPARRPDDVKPSPQSDNGTKSLETGNGFERGIANVKPWSGYWWPIREGRLLVPLGKYDRLTGHRAAVWEKKHNPPGPNVPQWFGYCHAWSAASVLEKEPGKERVFRLASSRLGLDLGDQKGLLTVCHTEDLANSWGDRFGDGQGSEDPKDLRPDRLWRLLKLHLGQQGVALVLDVEAGKEVWNYPIYQYELHYRPASDGRYLATLTLLMADDAVSPGYRGTKVRKQTYQFTFKMRGNSVISGSGEWAGRSKKDHPDFAWYPYKAVAQNPEVKYPKVQKLVGAGQSQPTQPSTPPTPPVPPPAEPVTPTTPPITPPSPPADPVVAPTQPVAPPNPEPTAPVTTTPTQATVPIVLSPIELVALIANKTSSFEFDATLDRFDGASYKPGETFSVRVKSEKPGYLYLLQVDSTGTPSLLYPTAGEDNRIPGGKLLEVKPNSAAGGFPIIGPAGVVRVKAVVTSRPLAFSGSLETLQQSQQQTQRQVSQSERRSNRQQATATRQRQTQARPVQFRWHPTQRQQIKELLSQDQQQTDPEQLGCRKPQDILGPFAQDMTVFYIDPKAPAAK